MCEVFFVCDRVFFTFGSSEKSEKKVCDRSLGGAVTPDGIPTHFPAFFP